MNPRVLIIIGFLAAVGGVVYLSLRGTGPEGDREGRSTRPWRAMQEQALRFGFRPADPAVPIKTQDASSPFTQRAEHGILVDVPPVAEEPEGWVVRNLLTMWSRVVATHR